MGEGEGDREYCPEEKLGPGLLFPLPCRKRIFVILVNQLNHLQKAMTQTNQCCPDLLQEVLLQPEKMKGIKSQPSRLVSKVEDDFFL